MKVAPSFNRKVHRPSHEVRGSRLDGNGAVRARPGLAWVFALTPSGLDVARHPVFDFGSFHAGTNQVEVELLWLFVALSALRAVTPRH